MLKLTIIIILAFLLLMSAVYFFFKGMTGRVVLDNNKNDTENNLTSDNESYDRNINNYNITDKKPEELNEGECILLESGKKVCLVKKGVKVTGGEVNTIDGQSG